MKRKGLIFTLSIVFLIGFIYLFNFAYVQINYPLKYKEEILKYSQQYNLEPTFVASIINAESSFNKDAVSNKGAIGLMQILPTTANYISTMLKEDFSTEKLFDADTNIRYGCFYLNYLKNRFNGEREVLCAYNAGETTVKSWLKNENLSNNGISLEKIPYSATNYYTNKILNSKKYYINRI